MLLISFPHSFTQISTVICYFLTMIKYWLQITNILNYNFPNHFNAAMLKATGTLEQHPYGCLALWMANLNHYLPNSR